ncbi:DUF1444 family protein [Aliicoccus persicus]|uniref:Uncharacterized protein YtpQ, UPF0354 family n=1 Tax=Aliicoccus persicus TaxID=930138 RepID=A0A662Z354_9STAP|nr:DUF1444 family protein [Aliicoccus persicus]SEV87710.1 Uncharacterized protein YtpQ, UPF0354 family [Aliicoccus persicus]
MNVFQLRDKIIERLNETRDDFEYKFDREAESLRIERLDNKQGVSVDLNKLLTKSSKDESLLDEIVYYLDESLTRMGKETIEQNAKILPVVRSTSFFKETKKGDAFVYDEHTAETNIYYAVDFDNSYRLIDEALLKTMNLSVGEMKVIAERELKQLPVEIKNQQVIQENVFYFINHNDGYDATRILNEEFLNDFHDRIEGEMLVGLPHQDVLIIVDVRNSVGYDVMAQMMMQYFAEGLTPITSLTFSYQDKRLQPVFILGKQKHNKKKDK